MVTPNGNDKPLPEEIHEKARKLIDGAMAGKLKICRMNDGPSGNGNSVATYAVCCVSDDPDVLEVLALLMGEKVLLAFRESPPDPVDDTPRL